MQCVILAGGLGTRMRSAQPMTPKTLLTVAGRPFAHWQLQWLAGQGVQRVLYSIGHLGAMVRDFVGNGSAWGLSVTYAEETGELLGTAGALRLAADLKKLDSEFFVLYGDSYLSIELAEVEQAFYEAGLPALMTVLRNKGRWDASNAIYADGRVSFYEKGVVDPPPNLCWIDYGLSVITSDVVRDLVPPGQRSDLTRIFGTLSRQGLLAGYEATERFYEIGSVAGLADLEAHLSPPSLR